MQKQNIRATVKNSWVWMLDMMFPVFHCHPSQTLACTQNDSQRSTAAVKYDSEHYTRPEKDVITQCKVECFREEGE